MDFNSTNENMILESSATVKHEVDEKSSRIEQKGVVKENEKIGLKKDRNTIFLLMYLYFLQGLPLGLAGSMPFILSSKKASFSDQGTFSFVFWPFSIKLLWAPLVDSIFLKRFGRRKSWLIPVQLLIGIFMLTFSSTAQNLAYNIQSQKGIRYLYNLMDFKYLTVNLCF
jgi:hypothetical protein